MTEENLPHNPTPESQDPIRLDEALRQFFDAQNERGMEAINTENEQRHLDARNTNLGQEMRVVDEELDEMRDEKAAAREAGGDLIPEAERRKQELGLELGRLQSQLWGDTDKAIQEQTIEQERDER